MGKETGSRETVLKNIRPGYWRLELGKQYADDEEDIHINAPVVPLASWQWQLDGLG